MAVIERVDGMRGVYVVTFDNGVMVSENLFDGALANLDAVSFKGHAKDVGLSPAELQKNLDADKIVVLPEPKLRG